MSKPDPKGWGSFMTEQTDEKVEVLIRKSEEEYVAPAFPIDTRVEFFLPTFATFGAETKERQFFLDTDWVFLNHGAFGAAMRPVVEISRRWADRMESQPLRFIDRELQPQTVYITRRMAKFIGGKAEDVVLMPNATMGLNTVFKNVSLNAGDVVLCFDTGYGATKKMLGFLKVQHGAEIVEMPIHFPVSGKMEVIKLFLHNVRKLKKAGKTIKLAVFDMVNSNSALVLPVLELCKVAQEHGIPTLVDGAHTLGSMDVNVTTMGCTYFVANAHKWQCSSKGAAVFYAHPSVSQFIVPPVISHGHKGGSLASEFSWQGLMDYGPWLSLHTCLDIWETIGVSVIRDYIHTLCRNAAHFLMQQWNTDALATPEMFGPMWCVRQPGPRVPFSSTEAVDIQNKLYSLYNIECPVKHMQNRLYVRISAHIHNEIKDYEQLASAMLFIRPKLTSEEDAKDEEEAQLAATVCQAGGCG